MEDVDKACISVLFLEISGCGFFWLVGCIFLFVCFLVEKLEVPRPFWQLFSKILAVLTHKLLGGREQIKPQAISSWSQPRHPSQPLLFISSLPYLARLTGALKGALRQALVKQKYGAVLTFSPNESLKCGKAQVSLSRHWFSPTFCSVLPLNAKQEM